MNIILNILKSILLLFSGTVASNKMHNVMLTKVLNAKIIFFERCTIGNIMNRFSNDIGIADNLLLSQGFEWVELVTKFTVYFMFVIV